MPALDVAHQRRRRGSRQPGSAGEVAGDVSGHARRHMRSDVLRRGTAFEVQARQQECDVDLRIADRRMVPVHRNRCPVSEAQIVTANIGVQQRCAVEQPRICRVDEDGQRAIQPRTRTETQRQQGYDIMGDERPSRIRRYDNGGGGRCVRRWLLRRDPVECL
jgi:hypothetical protein